MRCVSKKRDESLRNPLENVIIALHSREDSIKGNKAGAKEFITSPFQKEEVLERAKIHLKVKELNGEYRPVQPDIEKVTGLAEHGYLNLGSISFEFIRGC